MLDIGFMELLLVAIVTLLVLGPERLPGAIRKMTYWIGKIRHNIQMVKEELSKEIDIDSVQQQLYNETAKRNSKSVKHNEYEPLSHNDGSIVVIDSENITNYSAVNETIHSESITQNSNEKPSLKDSP